VWRRSGRFGDAGSAAIHLQNEGAPPVMGGVLSAFDRRDAGVGVVSRL